MKTITQPTATGQRSTIERLALSTEETAAALGVNRVTVWRLVKRGLLRPSKALRTPLFPRAEIERFLAETAA